VSQTADNRIGLRSYIRFQLAQLSTKNAAHQFEHLVFDLARMRIATNLLPATGPVQSGGDQGRDFESYRTFLARSPLARSSFAGRASEGIIAGACTLDKETVTKIRSDLGTIFASGERPTHVVYFCEPDLAVSKRHALKEHCRNTYGAALDIFDGQAIADMLADRDTSWIADKYLEIPPELWPATSLDEQYAAACNLWLVQKRIPENYADFLEIKSGLRTATSEDDAKRDLGGWIEAMRGFLAENFPERLLQKARYEISVAELRGRGSLDPAIPLVDTFLMNAVSGRPAAELRDAAVLTVYAWGAKTHRVSSVSSEKLAEWLKLNDDTIADALVATRSSGDRCLLLEAQALTALLPRETDTGTHAALNRFFDRWQEVVDTVQEVALFPIIHIADIFEKAATLIEPCDRLRALIGQVDALVADRAGKGAAADRARRRAGNHLEAGQYVAAIDELHHMKADWFTGENIEGSILAMLVLSQSYEELGLHIAARYYAAGALYTAVHADNEDVSWLVGEAAFRVADTFYAAGEGLTYIHSLNLALTAHHGVANDPHDWTRHPHVQRSVAHAVILRAIACRIAPRMVSLIDEAVAAWPLPPSEQDAFRAMSEDKPWSRMTTEEIEGKIADELGQHPFGDVGAEKSATWSAFGVLWTIRSVADRETWFAALELAAAIQIVQIEFADVDLLIIPSDVQIDVGLGDEAEPQCVQLPDNGNLVWQITMPKAMPDTPSKEYQAFLIGIVLIVLGQTTALAVSKLDELVEKRMERGLPGRVLSVRPLRELIKLAQPEDLDFAMLTAEPRPTLLTEFRPREERELHWRTCPGPAYCRSTAEEHLRSRYETTARGLRLTLPRMVDDVRCRQLLLRLREEGFLDWQVLNALLNMVAQWQVEAKLGRPMSPATDSRMLRDRIFREERDDDPPFDLRIPTEERIRMLLMFGVAGAFKTWGLVSHRRTPNFAAMKRLLDERYQHSADDIPHADPLSQGGSDRGQTTNPDRQIVALQETKVPDQHAGLDRERKDWKP
jgi:hypothetical protein